MTLEELFAEEYKSLKKDNEELKKSIERLKQDLIYENKKNTEFCEFLFSLDLRITKSDCNGKNYIEITNIVTTISEGNKFYDLISRFAKEDETKKEEEK